MKALHTTALAALLVLAEGYGGGLEAQASRNTQGLGVLGCESTVRAMMFHAIWGEEVVESLDAPDDVQPKITVHWQLWVGEKGGWSLTKSQAGITCMVLAGNEYDGKSISDYLFGESA